jgi:hypothetical protein
VTDEPVIRKPFCRFKDCDQVPLHRVKVGIPVDPEEFNFSLINVEVPVCAAHLQWLNEDLLNRISFPAVKIGRGQHV